MPQLPLNRTRLWRAQLGRGHNSGHEVSPEYSPWPESALFYSWGLVELWRVGQPGAGARASLLSSLLSAILPHLPIMADDNLWNCKNKEANQCFLLSCSSGILSRQWSWSLLQDPLDELLPQKFNKLQSQNVMRGATRRQRLDV